jgi:hypothetical protein
MWLEFIAPTLLLGVGDAGIGWFKTARLLHTTTREREDLAKSALVIEVERQMLELVAKGASLSEVLDTLTRAIEQLSPESHCTIMLLDEEHRRYLSIASGPSLPPAYLQAIDRLEIGPEVGACGSAAFRNETIVIDNIATDYRFASARKGLPIASNIAVSAVNQVVSVRMAKKQQMRWTDEGAHVAALVDGCRPQR